MDFPDLIHFNDVTPDEVKLRLLRPDEVEQFIELLTDWYPQFVEGSERRFTNPSFYQAKIFDSGKSSAFDSEFLPIVYEHLGSAEMAGCMFVEKNNDSLTVTSPMAATATKFRGRIKGLASLGPRLLLEIGKKMGAELAYYYSTLISLGNQRIAEKSGFSLVGIIPDFDRDLVERGTVKRSPEAIYAQVITSKAEILDPNPEALTPTTRRLWDFLFSADLVEMSILNDHHALQAIGLLVDSFQKDLAFMKLRESLSELQSARLSYYLASVIVANGLNHGKIVGALNGSQLIGLTIYFPDGKRVPFRTSAAQLVTFAMKFGIKRASILAALNISILRKRKIIDPHLKAIYAEIGCVKKDYRGKEIATRLKNWIFNEADQKGVGVACETCMSEAGAIWEHFGYKLYSESNPRGIHYWHYYRDPVKEKRDDHS